LEKLSTSDSEGACVTLRVDREGRDLKRVRIACTIG